MTDKIVKSSIEEKLILTIEQISYLSIDEIINLYIQGYRLGAPAPDSHITTPNNIYKCGDTKLQSQRDLQQDKLSQPIKTQMLSGTISCPNTVQYSSRTATANLTTAGIGPYTYAFYVNEDKKHENPSPITDTSYTFPAYAFNESVGSHNLRWRVTDYGCSPTKVDDVTCTINITACSYSIYPTSQPFGSSGGSGSFNVTTTTGCPWTATSNNPSWITVTSPSGGSGSGTGTVSYSVSSNTGTSSRTGTITAAGQTFTITQAGISCSYSISPSSASIPNAGGTGSFSVTSPAGCSWTATSNNTWITVTSYTGSGTGPVNYSVSSNSCGATRSGSITAAGQIFIIDQAAYTPVLSTIELTPLYTSPPLSMIVGGTQDFTATARDQCGNTMSGKTITWNIGTGISASPTSGTTNASGQTTTTVTADSVIAATYIQAITATVVSDGSFITVVSCSYVLSPMSQSFGSSGGSGSFNVATTTGCPWTATSNASWITVTSYTGSGTGTVNYSVSSNTSTSSRVGTITAAGQTFTITQDGITCSYSLGSTSESFDSDADIGTVTVTSPSTCEWTAVSNNTWITVTSYTGSGNGAVNYSVSSNTSTSSRTGTMTIAGQTFTITQSGYAPVLTSVTLSPAAPSTAPLSMTVGNTQPFTATARDQHNNPLSNQTITWNVGGSGITVNPTSGITGANGQTATTATAISATVLTNVQALTATVNSDATYITVAEAPPTTGSVIFHTSPGNAEIWNSGTNTLLGTTGGNGLVTIYGLTPGLMNFIVRKSGYYDSGVYSVTVVTDSTVDAPIVTLTVIPVLTTIDILPLNPTVPMGGTQQFSAVCKDQNDNSMDCPILIWDTTDHDLGIISPEGLFTALASSGTVTVTTTSESVVGSSVVTLSTVPPVQAGFGSPGIIIMAGLIVGAIYQATKSQI